jgi:hypothetical protein
MQLLDMGQSDESMDISKKASITEENIMKWETKRATQQKLKQAS